MIWYHIVSTPERWLAYWLRRRGWVCFYLDPQARVCRNDCWLRMYEDAAAREKFATVSRVGVE